MRRLAVVVAIAVAVVSPGCTKLKGERDRLGSIIYRTESLGRAFSGTDDDGTHHFRISGVISDDYRYRIASTVDGLESSSMVVVDDARAVRNGTGGWQVDPHGATNLFAATANTVVRVPTANRFKDMLQILKYVRTAIGEAATVVKFNPDSQDYRPKFDPVPKPSKDVLRYDIVPPTLAPRDPTTAAGNAAQLPGVRYFRKMAIYVRDDLVVQVREHVSISDTLRDPRSRLASRIGDYNITPPQDATIHEQATYIEQAVNATARRIGQPGVRIHDLDVRFSHLGERMPVTLPTGTKANLKTFDSDGQILFERAS